MRIKDIYPDQNDYCPAMRKRVETVFVQTAQIIELNELIILIKEESSNLRNTFWTGEEYAERQRAVSFLNARMQATVYYTIKNLEEYQHRGWKKLSTGGGIKDDTIVALPTEKD